MERGRGEALEPGVSSWQRRLNADGEAGENVSALGAMLGAGVSFGTGGGERGETRRCRGARGVDPAAWRRAIETRSAALGWRCRRRRP